MDDTKFKQFATLLAQSTLSDDIKKGILSNLEALSAEEFEALLVSLQNESKALGKIEDELEDLGIKEGEEWDKVSMAQQDAADAIIAKAAKDLGDEAAVHSIRKSLE